MTGLYQEDFVNSLQRAIKPLLWQWQLSEQTRLTLLCLSENATFRADDPGRPNPLIIRAHRPGYHSRREIISELEWIKQLRSDGIVSTAQPVTTSSGEPLVTLDDAGEQRHLAAFEFLPGIEPNESGDLSEGFHELGETTARLHQHAQQWRRPDTFTRKTWNFDTTIGDNPHWGDWRAALGLDNRGRRILQRCCELLREQLHEYGQGLAHFGLIHADLRLANLLVDGENLSVIDFDDCGFGWYLYDFAAAISFFETSAQIPALQQAWVAGYRQVAALDDAEVKKMPMFIMLRRLLLTAWVASHAETATAQELGSGYTADTVSMAEAYL
ncbi:MAG: Ser/Thr protein kinase RdoA (MazF antagonist), partial [Gammaproteobacteria bacterium]